MMFFWILNCILSLIYLGNIIYSVILQVGIENEIKECKKTQEREICIQMENQLLTYLLSYVLSGFVPCVMNLLSCIWSREAQKINETNEYETVHATLNNNNNAHMFSRTPY